MKKQVSLNKKWISLCLVSVGFMSTNAWAKSHRYVILSDDPASVEDELGHAGGNVEQRFRYHHGFAATMDESAAAALKAKFGGKVSIEIDGVSSIQALGTAKVAGKPGGGGGGSTQPAQVTQWGIKAVNAPSVWSITRGAGAVVCVLDTGVQSNHPDLQANIIGGDYFVPRVSSWNDDNGHGTHVAGIVAALDNTIGVVGVAPAAKIFAVKVLDSGGNGSNSTIAEGIDSCVAHGANIINMSFASLSDTSILHTSLINAANAGVILIAAAGNDGTTNVPFPAAYPEVIAVSALQNNGLQGYSLAYYSDFGPKIAFAAPGTSVYSTYLSSGYALLSGTSMAAPHVSGVAALMVSARSLGLIGRDIGLSSSQQGNGLIDALLTVQNQPSP